MKRFLIILALLYASQILHATHLKGGYITYKRIGGRTYEITLITFSDPASNADPNTASVSIDFGDGVKEITSRTSFVAIDSRNQKNTYVTNHTFAGNGIYNISCSDQNMIDGIKNINGGSSRDLPMYVESMLSIDDNGNVSSSVAYSILSEAKVAGGNTLYYNPSFYPSYHQYPSSFDSLVYELVTPKNLPNYQIPADLSIDPINGMIKWKNVPDLGIQLNYLIFYAVKSFIGRSLTGYNVCAQLINVSTNPNPSYPIVNLPNTSLTDRDWNKKIIGSTGQYSQEINFNQVVGNTASTTFYGEIPFTTTDSSTSTLSKFFLNFTIDSVTTPRRNWPYFFTIRNTYLSTNTIRDYSLALYFGASLTLRIKDIHSQTGSVNVFPNPFKNTCTFLMNDNDEIHDIFITDINGRNLYSGKLTGNEFLFDASSLKPGNYFYLIKSDEGKLVKGKLILIE